MRELHPFTTISPLGYGSNVFPKSQEDLRIQFLFRGRGETDSVPELPARNIRRNTWLSFFQIATKPTLQWTDKLANLTDKGDPLSEPGGKNSINQPWSDSFVELADQNQLPTYPSQAVDVPLRLEGPYFSMADPSRYKTIICFVAGTGVSGAIAIARTFFEQKRQQTEAHMSGREWSTQRGPAKESIWEKCVIIWSVRAENYIDLPFIEGRTITHD